jgi:hypothetical protein
MSRFIAQGRTAPEHPVRRSTKNRMATAKAAKNHLISKSCSFDQGGRQRFFPKLHDFGHWA